MTSTMKQANQANLGCDSHFVCATETNGCPLFATAFLWHLVLPFISFFELWKLSQLSLGHYKALHLKGYTITKRIANRLRQSEPDLIRDVGLKAAVDSEFHSLSRNPFHAPPSIRLWGFRKSPEVAFWQHSIWYSPKGLGMFFVQNITKLESIDNLARDVNLEKILSETKNSLYLSWEPPHHRFRYERNPTGEITIDWVNEEERVVRTLQEQHLQTCEDDSWNWRNETITYTTLSGCLTCVIPGAFEEMIHLRVAKQNGENALIIIKLNMTIGLQNVLGPRWTLATTRPINWITGRSSGSYLLMKTNLWFLLIHLKGKNALISPKTIPFSENSEALIEFTIFQDEGFYVLSFQSETFIARLTPPEKWIKFEDFDLTGEMKQHTDQDQDHLWLQGSYLIDHTPSKRSSSCHIWMVFDDCVRQVTISTHPELTYNEKKFILPDDDISLAPLPRFNVGYKAKRYGDRFLFVQVHEDDDSTSITRLFCFFLDLEAYLPLYETERRKIRAKEWEFVLPIPERDIEAWNCDLLEETLWIRFYCPTGSYLASLSTDYLADMSCHMFSSEDEDAESEET